MKTAEEARVAMKSFDPTKLPGYKKVEIAIESAISNNKSYISMEPSIDSRLELYLTSIGYKVETFNDRNVLVTSISW